MSGNTRDRVLASSTTASMTRSSLRPLGPYQRDLSDAGLESWRMARPPGAVECHTRGPQCRGGLRRGVVRGPGPVLSAGLHLAHRRPPDALPALATTVTGGFLGGADLPATMFRKPMLGVLFGSPSADPDGGGGGLGQSGCREAPAGRVRSMGLAGRVGSTEPRSKSWQPTPAAGRSCCAGGCHPHGQATGSSSSTPRVAPSLPQIRRAPLLPSKSAEGVEGSPEVGPATEP
jgi:hypothetical protein